MKLVVLAFLIVFFSSCGNRDFSSGFMAPVPQTTLSSAKMEVDAFGPFPEGAALSFQVFIGAEVCEGVWAMYGYEGQGLESEPFEQPAENLDLGQAYDCYGPGLVWQERPIP